ncbi:MAG: hypothetical protein WAW17_07075 [Rhodococcus sp. (in: high G+C Gram-positive bacteria)]|uniref:hypothetical protein n=1 Tax=Rhodococcus sp. TaxID=1831 RepID=UPI003BAFB9EE
MNILGEGNAFDIVAQGIRDTGNGSSFDPSAILPWLAGILAGAVLVVAAWRAFKAFLSDGKDGADVNPEAHTKKQSNIAISAGVAIAFITIGALVIGFVVNIVTDLVG